MAFKSALDKTGQAFRNGEDAEYSFLSLCKHLGFSVKRADLNQDRKEHFDFIVNNGKDWKVEVKSQKKINRSNQKYDDNWTWVEFEGVTGHKGWLYGQSDFIAFELSNHFLIVSTKKLKEFCENNVDKSKFVLQAKDAKYKLYQRKGRKDSVALIAYKDIKSIKNTCLVKKN